MVDERIEVVGSESKISDGKVWLFYGHVVIKQLELTEKPRVWCQVSNLVNLLWYYPEYEVG